MCDSCLVWHHFTCISLWQRPKSRVWFSHAFHAQYVTVPYSIAMKLNDATWHGHGCAIVVMSCSLLHWYNLYVNGGHCWTYNIFVSGEEGHHQMCMWLTTQHMNTLIAWYVCIRTHLNAMNTYMYGFCRSFQGCAKRSTVSLRKLHRRCFLKRFYPEAKVTVRGNSRSPTSKLASSLTESLTTIEDRKTN